MKPVLRIFFVLTVFLANSSLAGNSEDSSLFQELLVPSGKSVKTSLKSFALEGYLPWGSASFPLKDIWNQVEIKLAPKDETARRKAWVALRHSGRASALRAASDRYLELAQLAQLYIDADLQRQAREAGFNALAKKIGFALELHARTGTPVLLVSNNSDAVQDPVVQKEPLPPSLEDYFAESDPEEDPYWWIRRPTNSVTDETPDESTNTGSKLPPLSLEDELTLRTFDSPEFESAWNRVKTLRAGNEIRMLEFLEKGDPKDPVRDLIVAYAIGVLDSEGGAAAAEILAAKTIDEILIRKIFEHALKYASIGSAEKIALDQARRDMEPVIKTVIVASHRAQSNDAKAAILLTPRLWNIPGIDAVPAYITGVSRFFDFVNLRYVEARGGIGAIQVDDATPENLDYVKRVRKVILASPGIKGSKPATSFVEVQKRISAISLALIPAIGEDRAVALERRLGYRVQKYDVGKGLVLPMLRFTSELDRLQEPELGTLVAGLTASLNPELTPLIAESTSFDAQAIQTHADIAGNIGIAGSSVARAWVDRETRVATLPPAEWAGSDLRLRKAFQIAIDEREGGLPKIKTAEDLLMEERERLYLGDISGTESNRRFERAIASTGSRDLTRLVNPSQPTGISIAPTGSNATEIFDLVNFRLLLLGLERREISRRNRLEATRALMKPGTSGWFVATQSGIEIGAFEPIAGVPENYSALGTKDLNLYFQFIAREPVGGYIPNPITWADRDLAYQTLEGARLDRRRVKLEGLRQELRGFEDALDREQSEIEERQNLEDLFRGDQFVESFFDDLQQVRDGYQFQNQDDRDQLNATRTFLENQEQELQQDQTDLNRGDYKVPENTEALEQQQRDAEPREELRQQQLLDRTERTLERQQRAEQRRLEAAAEQAAARDAADRIAKAGRQQEAARLRKQEADRAQKQADQAEQERKKRQQEEEARRQQQLRLKKEQEDEEEAARIKKQEEDEEEKRKAKLAGDALARPVPPEYRPPPPRRRSQEEYRRMLVIKFFENATPVNGDVFDTLMNPAPDVTSNPPRYDIGWTDPINPDLEELLGRPTGGGGANKQQGWTDPVNPDFSELRGIVTGELPEAPTRANDPKVGENQDPENPQTGELQ